MIERVILHLRDCFGQDVEMDLVTCYAGEPAGFRGRIYNVNDYGGAAGRDALRLTCSAELLRGRRDLRGRAHHDQVEMVAGLQGPREDFHHQRKRRLFLAGSRAPRPVAEVRNAPPGDQRIGRGALAGAAGVFPGDARLSVVVRWHGAPTKELRQL